MTLWMKTELQFGVDEEKTFRAVIEGLAQGDSRRGIDIDIALFIRECKGDKTSLLLSPRASGFFLFLPGDWEPSHDHFKHKWRVLFSNGVKPEELGLNVG